MSRYEIKQDDDAIDAVLDCAMEAENTGKSAYHGMTYEQGISDGILWVTGQSDNEPPLP